MDFEIVVGKVTESLSNDWVRSFAIVIVIYLALSLVSKYLKRGINRKFSDTNVKLRLRSLVSISFGVLFSLSVLAVFSGKLSGLTVAFGVAGAGIAFALQEVITSLAGWFAIHFGNFFNIGDRVMLGGIKGDVIDISLLRTTVMEIGGWVNGDQYNGRVVRIANSFLFKEPVYNYSADFPFIWDEISIPVKYDSDIPKTRGLIKEITDRYFDAYEERAKTEWKVLVERYVIENALVDNQIYMTADENWLSFNIRYVTDFKARRKTKDDLFTEIIQAIEKNSDFVGIAGASIEVTGNGQFFKSLNSDQRQTSI